MYHARDKSYKKLFKNIIGGNHAVIPQLQQAKCIPITSHEKSRIWSLRYLNPQSSNNEASKVMAERGYDIIFAPYIELAIDLLSR